MPGRGSQTVAVTTGRSRKSPQFKSSWGVLPGRKGQVSSWTIGTNLRNVFPMVTSSPF